MVPRCNGVQCVHFYYYFFFIRTNVEKGNSDEKDFRHCYGTVMVIFFESAILKLRNHSCKMFKSCNHVRNHDQSSFSTIMKHIENNILKDTLQ